MNYKEMNTIMHQEQVSQLGFCGVSDVELAREIYLALETVLHEEYGENEGTNKIAKIIKKYRTY